MHFSTVVRGHFAVLIDGGLPRLVAGLGICGDIYHRVG
jgi:hypothetical protein